MRTLTLLMATVALMAAETRAHANVGAAASAPCVDADGRTPIIEAGREREVRALFSPHEAGSRLPPPASGWTFDSIRIERSDLVVVLVDPQGQSHEPRFGPVVCAPEDAKRSASFYRSDGDADADTRGAVDLLWSALTSHDAGGFYRSFVTPPKVVTPARRAPSATAGQTSAPDPRRIKGEASSWFRTQSALAVLLVLGLILGLVGMLAHARDMGLAGDGSRNAWAQLAAITTLGGAVRALVAPTFLREAYPLPNVHYLVHGLDWGGEIATYPQAQALLARGLSPILSAYPFDAWFQLNWLLGTLAIPAAWAAGAALGASRRTAAIAALLLACWPQHIRFTASESTHIGFVLGALVVLALSGWAARSGKTLTFACLAFATALTVVARPEGGLLIPGVALLVLAGGPGAWDLLRNPIKIASVVAAAALVVPTLLHIATSESASAFDPDAGTGEALSSNTLLTLLIRLLWPSEHNAFFDLQTCPPWLYLLAIGGVVHSWRSASAGGSSRGANLGLVVIALTYFTLYAGMEPAITIWGMGRYHLAILPVMVVLSALGLDALGQWVVHRTGRARAGIATTLAATLVGLVAWWPAVTALPLDWQTELDWLIERGRTAETRVSLPSRLVLPDNRRRFRDLSPRAPILALSGGQAREENAVTIAQAIEHLDVATAPSVVFLESLYCHLAVDGDEPENPQCAAMKATFELELVDEVVVRTPPFLVGYVDLRRAAPFPLRLWRVTGRKLDAQAGLALLPRPITPGDPRAEQGGVIGSPTSAAMWPCEPPLP